MKSTSQLTSSYPGSSASAVPPPLPPPAPPPWAPQGEDLPDEGELTVLSWSAEEDGGGLLDAPGGGGPCCATDPTGATDFSKPFAVRLKPASEGAFQAFTSMEVVAVEDTIQDILERAAAKVPAEGDSEGALRIVRVMLVGKVQEPEADSGFEAGIPPGQWHHVAREFFAWGSTLRVTVDLSAAPR